MAGEHWTSRISNETLCGFFNGFYWVYVLLTALAVIALIFTIVKMSGAPRVIAAFTNLIVLSISATMMLFHSLICERALGVKA